MAKRILIFHNGTVEQINLSLRLLNRKWPKSCILLVIKKRHSKKIGPISKCHIFARKNPIGWFDAFKLLHKLKHMKFNIIGISKQDMTIKILLGIFLLRPEKILFFRGYESTGSVQQMIMFQFSKWFWDKQHVFQSALIAVFPLMVFIFQIPFVFLKNVSLTNKKQILATVFGNLKQGPLSDSPWLFMWLQVAMLHSFIFSKTNSAEIKRILVIRIDHIGDNVNTIPLVRKLRTDFPDAKISLLCDTGAFIWKNCPYIDEILIYKTNNPLINRGKKNWKWCFLPFTFYTRILRGRFDLVIDPVGRTETHIISYFCTAARRISNTYYPYELYGIEIPLRHYQTLTHETVRALALWRPEAVITEDDTRLEVWITDAEQNKAKSVFAATGLAAEKRCVGIHPGAMSRLRLWPIERFVHVAYALYATHGMQIVYFEPPGMEAMTATFVGMLASRGVSTAIVRPADLRSLMVLIAKCDLFVCLDSGPMHLAAASNIPTVAIFGPGEYWRWQPRHNGGMIVRQPLDCAPCSQDVCQNPKCMLSVSANEVISACEKLLKTSEPKVCAF